MTSSEVRGTTPGAMIRELEDNLRRTQENKYSFQVGLKDLDFDVNPDLLQMLGLALPMKSIGEAEQALRAGGILPKSFIEFDDTPHQVLVFDPRPVGYSGFMDCVTHSLALTDQGLFEVGRYPAVSLGSSSRYWGWFLHRRLASPEEAAAWQDVRPTATSRLESAVAVTCARSELPMALARAFSK